MQKMVVTVITHHPVFYIFSNGRRPGYWTDTAHTFLSYKSPPSFRHSSLPSPPSPSPSHFTPSVAIPAPGRYGLIPGQLVGPPQWWRWYGRRQCNGQFRRRRTIHIVQWISEGYSYSLFQELRGNGFGGGGDGGGASAKIRSSSQRMDRLSTKFITVIGLTGAGQSYIIRTLVSPLYGADRLVSALLNTSIFSLPRILWCAAT